MGRARGRAESVIMAPILDHSNPLVDLQREARPFSEVRGDLDEAAPDAHVAGGDPHRVPVQAVGAGRVALHDRWREPPGAMAEDLLEPLLGVPAVHLVKHDRPIGSTTGILTTLALLVRRT